MCFCWFPFCFWMGIGCVRLVVGLECWVLVQPYFFGCKCLSVNKEDELLLATKHPPIACLNASDPTQICNLPSLYPSIPSPFLVASKKMKASVLASLILFSSCLFELLHTSDANQAENLQLLINKSQQFQGSVYVNSWDNLDDEKVYKPVCISSHDGLMEADKIDELPGQPQGVDFDQYAGYVTVDEKAGRALFYYFVESPHDPSTKPLVLWLNGGPGCSSLGGGAMMELGPFRVNSDVETLYANQYAWNNVANVIFLESPAGVGFSYSNTTSDYKLSGDKRTADDAYTFLVNWLERFPQYKARDFYITGESYAGHYVPELASTILSHNKITNQTVINLKGIAIGNPVVDIKTNTKAVYDYYWTHALLSDEAHQAISSSCNFTNQTYTPECTKSLKAARTEVEDIDHYNIYAPLCDSSSYETTIQHNEADPCSEFYTVYYLNLPEVQKALHANVTNLQYPWSVCRHDLSANWLDRPATTLPIIKHLINKRIRVWFYSGDFDAVVPVTSTRKSVKNLGLPVKTSWRPWYAASEVGGYVVEYKGLTFATVRGAGHLVPRYQPERALILFESFLGGILPPAA